MVYAQLFFSFMKIGFTSFGGMSMIPLIMEEVQSHQWMNAEDMTNLVAIAEMTPGPLGVNCATFAGIQAAGISGGIAAVAGVLMPAFTLAYAAAVFFVRFRESKLMTGIMSYVKPVCIAMILSVILTLSEQNYMENDKLDFIAVCIGVVSLWLLIEREWPVHKVILCSAISGIAGYGCLNVFLLP